MAKNSIFWIISGKIFYFAFFSTIHN